MAAPQGGAPIVYDGPLKQEQLHMFLAQHIKQRSAPEGSEEAQRAANYSSLPTVPVYNISGAQLKEMNDDRDMFLVGFHKADGGWRCWWW
jgi:hypothetical protein